MYPSDEILDYAYLLLTVLSPKLIHLADYHIAARSCSSRSESHIRLLYQNTCGTNSGRCCGKVNAGGPL